jgi:hypothetical protein
MAAWSVTIPAACNSKGIYERACADCNYGERISFLCGCNECALTRSRPGHVLGNSEISIADALEILKFLAGLNSMIIPNSGSWNAALIVSQGTPSAADALEILKKAAGIDNAIDRNS